MGLLGSLFNLADDIVSIPTDIIGLTNHHEKKEILAKAKKKFIKGKITAAQYERIKEML